MRRTGLFAGLAAVALLLGSGVGHAAESHTCGAGFCTASDDNPYVDEPILTRSQLLPVTTDRASLAQKKLEDANITSFTLSAVNGTITATVTTLGPVIRSAGHVAEIAPYEGQHLFVLFQTPDFERDQVVGKDAGGQDVHWGPPGTLAEGFRWFMTYGWDLQENRETCAFGYYAPEGEVVPSVGVYFGSYFFVVGSPSLDGSHSPTITCTISPDQKTLTVQIPYSYGYFDYTGTLPRSLQVVRSGELVSNASAFSYMDQEVGAGNPVGTLAGTTWATDAVPEASLDRGVVSLGPAGVDAPNDAVDLPTGPTLADSHLDFVVG